MEELKLPGRYKKDIQSFIQGLKYIYGGELISVILYGSAASGEFIDKHSNLNFLVVLKNTDLDNLKRASGLIGRLPMITPLFLTESYIASSTDIFPIEFLDMRENYSVFYGKDVLKDITIDVRNLRFQCEQELKAKLLNLRHLYLSRNTDKNVLRNLLFKSFTSILHILRNVLRLKGRKPPYQKKDVLNALADDLQIDKNVWDEILAAKLKRAKLGAGDIEKLFTAFLSDLERIVDMVDRL